MKILFNDIIQKSNASAALKSPSLADVTYGNMFDITFDKNYYINCVGIGNTDAENIQIDFWDYRADNMIFSRYITYTGNGLYFLSGIKEEYEMIKIRVNLLGGSYIGRIAIGRMAHIPTAIAKEPGLVSTAEFRRSLSGQVIPGMGGYTYRTLSLDSRYKIDTGAMQEIEAGFPVIAKGYPFFIDLSDEEYKLGYSKLYATEKEQTNWVFQGGVRRFLYSRKFDFEEAF